MAEATIVLSFCARCKQLLRPRPIIKRRRSWPICPRCQCSVAERSERVEGTFSDVDAALMMRQPL
jgi:hypothetical protein